jgi:hypothetical protein
MIRNDLKPKPSRDSVGSTTKSSGGDPMTLATYVVTDNESYKQIRQFMINTGLVSKKGSFTSINNVWQTAWQNASLYNNANPGKKPITTLEYLRLIGLGSGSSGGGSGRGGSGGAGGTTTQTQRSVNISSAKDAKALINQSFQQSVGRDATDDEIKQFRSALNAEEKKNPSITKTTQTVSGSNVSTTNETTGGMDRGAYMLEQGQKASDYAEFQTETTYMDALMSAIGGGQ